ncbi:inhibin beta E chain [Nephila pilipes]|uniref:Inhibin beta E chain n=1 Tax=Nephila pilipes TaxID=299642 RepID=A0A8X6U9P7_NEPPI|nr:inhibin beta E chain [Nephila pilipes]GFU07147.1 inhibin beta E chain [Nephila pilipes]
MQVVFKQILFAVFLAVSVKAERSPTSHEENDFRSRVVGITLNDIMDLLNTEIEISPEAIANLIFKNLNLGANSKSPILVPPIQSFMNKINLWNNYDHVKLNHSILSSWSGIALNSQLVINTGCHRNGPKCLRFRVRIPHHVLMSNEFIAELILFKKEEVTEFTIIQIIDESRPGILHEEIFNAFNQTQAAGWTGLDVTYLVKNILTYTLVFEFVSNSNIPVEIEKGKHPFLVVFMNSAEDQKYLDQKV